MTSLLTSRVRCLPLQRLLILARHSADLFAELLSSVAAGVGVASSAVLSMHCGPVQLQDRYDVDQLQHRDKIVLKLKAEVDITKPPVNETKQ